MENHIDKLRGTSMPRVLDQMAAFTPEDVRSLEKFFKDSINIPHEENVLMVSTPKGEDPLYEEYKKRQFSSTVKWWINKRE